jgi:hypothetical protein
VSQPTDTPANVRRGGLAVTITIHVIFFALGMLLAVYGAMLSARAPRLWDHLFSLGVLVAVVGNAAVAVLGRMAIGKWGGATPLVGWLLIAYLVSITRPNGSFLLAGGDLQVPSLLFQVGGAVAGAVAATLKPPRRWRRPET